MVPCLKFLRGDGFTPEHWAMMFKVLELEKGLTADKLQFLHFVDHAAVIVNQDLPVDGSIQCTPTLQGLFVERSADFMTWGTDDDGGQVIKQGTAFVV